MLSIYVDYQLLEYIKVLKEFAPTLLARENRESGKDTEGIKWYQLILLYMIAPSAFFYKKLRVGNCTFEFDSNVIKRQSKAETIEISWSDVKQIHRLSEAFLIELDQGGLPIPIRCFDDQQLELFLNYSKCIEGQYSTKDATNLV